MRRRRRRILRDDVVAPWVIVSVILGLWWLGASFVRPHLAPSAASAAAESSARPGTYRLRSRPQDLADAMASADRADGAIPAHADSALLGSPDALEAPVTIAAGDISELLAKRLLVPVAGVEPSSLRSSFRDARGSSRKHEAIDILAPRGAPVVAALEGRIVKLFTSAAGGLTIYQYDPDETFCYYYAHLDGYASNLTEGQWVTRGQTIGYVGTTGNAPPGTPHLHFAIFKLDAEKRWWKGAALDPYLVLR